MINSIPRSGTIGRTVGVEPHAKRHPTANDIDRLVELADATLDDDRKAARTHGASGIGVSARPNHTRAGRQIGG